jgi:hypothetical protein
MKKTLVLSSVALLSAALLYLSDDSEQASIENSSFSINAIGEQQTTVLPALNERSATAFFSPPQHGLSTQSLSFRPSEGQGKPMTIVPCRAIGEDTVTHAFMLPPGWQAKCQTGYTLFENLIVYHPKYTARKASSSIELANTDVERHNYDPNIMRMQKEMMDMSGGWSNPQLLQNYRNLQKLHQPPPQDFPAFVKQRATSFMQQQGYQLYHLSHDPLTQNYVQLQMRQIPPQLRSKMRMEIVTAVGENNTGNIGLIKFLLVVFHNQGFYHWQVAGLGATAAKSEIDDASNLVNLTLMTLQENMQHSLSIQQINSRYLKKQRQSFQQAQSQIAKTNREIGDIIHQGYMNRTKSQARMQSKIVDSIWEVDEYRNPIDNSIVKAPMHNRYYYTNNLGDYIGTNNPMLNNEIGLTTLYNWTELQRTY